MSNETISSMDKGFRGKVLRARGIAVLLWENMQSPVDQDFGRG
jgi:hypothetical protein